MKLKNLTIVVLLSLAFMPVAASEMETLHEQCRNYVLKIKALPLEQLKEQRFGACEKYNQAAKTAVSHADLVLSSTYMARLYSEMFNRFEDRGDISRRGMLGEAKKAAEHLTGEFWMIPEFLTLTSLKGWVPYNEIIELKWAVFQQLKPASAKDSVEWAALYSDAAAFFRGRIHDKTARRDFEDQALDYFPQALDLLSGLEDGDYKTQRLTIYHRTRSDILENRDPEAALDALFTSYGYAKNWSADAVSLTQLFVSNLLRDQPTLLTGENRKKVWAFVKETPDSKYKGYILSSLSSSASNCQEAQELLVYSMDYDEKNGNSRVTPTQKLMLAMMQGNQSQVILEIRLLACLDPDTLRRYDSDKQLHTFLQRQFPVETRQGDWYTLLAMIEGKLE